MLPSLPLTIRPPPLDHVNKLRHHCKVPASRRSDLIHIDRNVLFTSPEYADVNMDRILGESTFLAQVLFVAPQQVAGNRGTLLRSWAGYRGLGAQIAKEKP